jgi:uncharacterized SAM-binding protein YcdF (DUF218 family)
MRHRAARWLVRAAGLPLSRGAEPQAADAAVILGAPLRNDGTLTEVVEERVREGVELWRRGLARVVCVAGGLGPRGARPEAHAMAERARALGVPEEALRVDDVSANTRENAMCAARLLLPEHPRVWVVTQPFHLRRALFWFRRVGFEPLGWHIEDSVQYRHPWRGLKWVVREYGAWVRLGAWEVWLRGGGKRPGS